MHHCLSHVPQMQLHARTNQYYYSFLPRTIPDWNNLGIDDLANCDLDSFKIIYLVLINYFQGVATLIRPVEPFATRIIFFD